MNSLRPYSQSIGQMWNATKTLSSFHRDVNQAGYVIAGKSSTALTSSVRGFPVRTFPTLEKVQGLTGSDPDCSLKSFAWLENSGHGRYYWRTYQRCLIEGWIEYVSRWPRSGFVVSGCAFQLPELVHHTSETGSSFLPTPNASDATRGPESIETKRKRGSGGVNLAEAQKHWPTPTSRDHKGCGKNGRVRDGKIQTDTLDRAVWFDQTSQGSQSTGQLNPQWVSWLMGFPVDWCDLPDEQPIEFQAESKS